MCGAGIVESNAEGDLGSVGCGNCPTDVDGAGETKAFDLAFLLGNWGELPKDADPAVVCLDANDDGEIRAFDLAFLLGNWGDCPPPLGGDDNQCIEGECLDNCQCVGRGACCGVKGDPAACDENLTAEECAAAGGNYAGDDSICDDCPDPICFDA